VNKPIQRIAWGLALGPLLLPAFLLLAALHLRVQLGHWAVPMFDDYDGHHTVFLWLIGLAVIPGIPFWMTIFFTSFREVPLKHRVLQVATYVFCWAFFAVYCHIDPWRYIEWYMD
jgi:hypothetical protein